MGNVDGREFEGSRTMKLNLEGCDSILWIQKTLQRTILIFMRVEWVQKERSRIVHLWIPRSEVSQN